MTAAARVRESTSSERAMHVAAIHAANRPAEVPRLGPVVGFLLHPAMWGTRGEGTPCRPLPAGVFRRSAPQKLGAWHSLAPMTGKESEQAAQ